MEKVTSISEMLKFHFGSKIFCSDGEEGFLTHVAFDQATRCLTHIGIKEGRFFGKSFYLPFPAVVGATGDGVTLNITRTDLAQVGQENPSRTLFDAKSIVQLTDASTKGTVSMIAVHPKSGELAYVVVHHLRAGVDTQIQQEYIKQIESGRFTVSIPDTVLQSLPPYRSDAELQQEVEALLFDITPLHVDFKGLKVRVLDSVLYLEGNISSSLRADLVQDQAMGVQGLLEIENHLIGDDTLAAQLATELAHNAQTRDLPIGVYPKLGVVRLSGAVHNEQQKAAAGEMAKHFPGVLSVINDLIVDPKATMIHVMSSAEGGEASDIVPGKYIRHTK